MLCNKARWGNPRGRWRRRWFEGPGQSTKPKPRAKPGPSAPRLWGVCGKSRNALGRGGLCEPRGTPRARRVRATPASLRGMCTIRADRKVKVWIGWFDAAEHGEDHAVYTIDCAVSVAHVFNFCSHPLLLLTSYLRLVKLPRVALSKTQDADYQDSDAVVPAQDTVVPETSAETSAHETGCTNCCEYCFIPSRSMEVAPLLEVFSATVLAFCCFHDLVEVWGNNAPAGVGFTEK